MHPGDEETDLAQVSWWSRMIHWSLQPRILGTVVLAGLFVVVIPALPSLWPTISQRDRFKLSVDAIELTAASNWAPHDVAQRVAADHHLEWSERSLLDKSLVADLAAAFATHPWIEKVDRVEKTRQGRVVVQVTYRTPVAMVETIRGLQPVDAHGYLLPPSDFSTAESDQLPRLRDIKSLPNGKAGQLWGDPIVAAGAKLCSELLVQKGTLDSYWTRFGLEAVIAPPPPSTVPTDIPVPLVFQLLTKKKGPPHPREGRLIIWGRAPGDDALEPTVAQKIGRLEEYVKLLKSLELPEDGLVLDLRPFSAIRRISREELNHEILR